MSDGTVNTPSSPPEACLGGAWPANIKLLFDTAMATQTKIITDAQNAANLALLNAVNNADALAKQSLRHAELAAANQWQEQEEGAGLDDDDIDKIQQAVTAAVTAVLANMATGRPPVNQSGTTATPVAGA
jgi:hypothetical protein